MLLITDVLRHTRKGEAVDVATAEFATIIEKVKETGNPGSVTIKLTIKPKKGDDGMVEIHPTVTSSRPAKDLASGLFFIDQEGGLSRTDPNQREMFGEAGAAPKAVREA